MHLASDTSMRRPSLPSTRVTCAEAGVQLAGEVVQARCCATAGRWSCLTHERAFRAAHEKNMHVERDMPGVRHVLVWLCDLHGPEAPERWNKP